MAAASPSNLQLLVRLRIRDSELLHMERRVGLKGEPARVLALDIDKEFFVLGAEAVEKLGMDRDLKLMDLLLMTLHKSMKRALEFDAHGHLALHDTFAVAIGAVRVERTRETLLSSLTGHLHKAKR